MTSQQIRPVMTAEAVVVHEHRFDAENDRCRCGASETETEQGDG